MTDNRSRSTAPHVTRLTLVLLTSTMLSGVPQLHAQVLPTGGSVAAGSASIGTPSNGALTVTQSSSSAVVNWQSFSVGQGNAVNFVQPSSTSAILNRVTGSATSTIAGQINANGQVYLVNPNGIAITATGTVNAAGFVASTLGISDSDFMAGKRTFTGNGASAGVSNAGTITIGRGGYAALLGGSVDNAGTINVPLGRVGLGSGEQATLDLSGDGFMQVAVPTRAAGSGALVSNSGRISANGGSVQLSAAAARDMARQAINMSGTIEARSVGGRNGAIVLGGSGGAVAVSGKLNVASRRAKGGTITVTGRDIKLSGATLDASGKTGGGTIKIGGDRQGQGTLQRAETTTIDAATTIKADATQTGNGGNVTVWSNGATSVHGLISATGGAISGDGGQIETSGHTLDFAGIRIHASAANGKSGTWLLDPEDLTVDAAAAATISTTLGGGTDVTLLTTSTTASGGFGNTSSGNGDIFVNAAIGWSSSALLTLNAYNAIAINAPITVGGAGGVSLIYNTASPTNLTFAQGASIDYGANNQGATLTINGSSYTLLYSMADVSNVNNLGLGGSYALAGSLDASGSTYTDALIGRDNSHSFTGSFEGLGHTIRNLTVNKSGDYAGLFGYSSGTIRDIGLTGGSVSGGNNVGGLVGYQAGGTISNAYATGAVSSSGSYFGGLVGVSIGTISNAYATGAVSGVYIGGGLVGVSTGTISNAYATGAVSSGVYVGGLVGALFGSISNAYATGAVSGDNSYVGGLVGYQDGGTISNAYATGAATGNASLVGGLVGRLNSGTISSAYATGAVSGGGGSLVGGLVGKQFGGTISNAYWDTQTSGITTGIGSFNSGNVTGLTTAQFQTAAAATNLGAAFSGGAGLYPYLTSFYPNGVQAISGKSYADSGVTLNSSNGNGARYVYVDVAGRQYVTTTGANGYYYVMVANGTLSTTGGGTATLAYTRDGNVTGPVSGATLTTATGSVQHFDIWTHNLIAPTTATSLSTAPTTAAALLAAAGGADQTLLTAAAGSDTIATDAVSGVAGLGSTGYLATGAGGFNVDQGISAYGLYVQTISGPITVSSAQTLGGPINLTLLSAGGLTIDAPIQVNGNGAVTLAYDASSASNISFGLTGSGFTGSLTYANADGTAAAASQGGSLSVNGQGYTLLYSMADVANVNNNLAGNYALAGNLDATGNSYTTGVIAGGSLSSSYPLGFSGTFEGLGHTVANLTINGSTNNFVGLIGYSTGTIRNTGITGGSFNGRSNVGSLVGYLDASGAISNAYATGAVSGTGFSVGGLVGQSNGSISNAYATGAVNARGYVGGLVGESNGSISNAYATSAVGGTDNVFGGLVGESNGSISNAYATGAVSGSGYVGGLVGLSSGTIGNAYATGAVSGTGGYVGGLAGYLANSSTISNAYWDVLTSGTTTGLGSDGNNQSGNVIGLTTAQFQTATSATNLGAAFSGGNSGLYPYLASFYPDGVQAISGFAYQDAGTAVLASGGNGAVTVTGFANVASFGSATTGVNGYYYIFGAAGSFTSGNSLLTYTSANSQTGATNSATLVTASGAANQSGLNLYGNALTASTSATTLSGAPTRSVTQTSALAATGGDAAATAAINATTARHIIATGASFTIDQSVDTANTLVVQTTAAGAWITVANAITVESGGSLGLLASGALTINAPIQVNGNGAVTLAYDASSVSNLSFGLTGSGFTGSLTYANADGTAATSSQGGTLSINGNAITLLYSMAEVSNVNNGLNGSYALAGSLDASGTTYTDALIGRDNSHSFTGSFEGLGHTIRDLTISKSGDYAGLFGYSSGTIRDIGLTGGSVSGSGNYVGGLVGYQAGGTISNAYATGAVSGTSYVGGLVGVQDSATISNVYATGAVSSSGGYVGGLVGYDFQGTIGNAYATGAVSGRGDYVGGLVGALFGSTISNVYATGAVNGSANVGGLVGASTGTISNAYATGAVSGSGSNSVGGLVGFSIGTNSNAYWDTQTSGTSTGIGNTQSGNVTGLTTADLQTATAASDLGSAFAGGPGLYPYLTSFFPNGVQVVSGFAYKDGGVTPLASGANGAAYVSIAGNGQTLGSVTTGANGYYYAFLPMGTLTSNSGVAAYTQANVATGATDAVSYFSGTPGQITSLDISGGWRRDTTLASSLTTLDAGFATTTSGTPVAGFMLPNRSIFAVNDFVLDTALSVTGTLDLASPSHVTQTAAFSAGALILEGSNAASFNFTNTGNQFGQLAASGGAINVYDANSLTIAASVSTACGCVVTGVATTDAVRIATAGDLTIASGAVVSGASPVLAASGAFINSAGSGAVVATAGSWLVYLAAPAGNTFGNLDSGNTAIWGTAAGGAVTATGNRYVFAEPHILTVTVNGNVTKTYGQTAVLPGTTISGAVQPGVAGAYLGDTLANLTSGVADVSSDGAAATASPGIYAIVASQGSLRSATGYGFRFVPGMLTVDAVLSPAPSELASTVVNSTPPGMIVTAAMPGSFSPPSGNGSGSTILFADPRFDGVLICGGLNCVVASTQVRP